MTYEIDQRYLLRNQYKDASNLSARIQLHQTFSTSPVNWYRWVFDQYAIAPHSRILELGCGPALHWQKNLDRISDNWDVTLSDFSAGMLQEAQNNLCNSDKHFSFRIIDAQSIPFVANNFDVVIANHMLYHVPDRVRAFAEIRRVLKPEGHFYATTNGHDHLQEILQLKQRADITAPSQVASTPFTLENGSEQLAHWFTNVEMRPFANGLAVTETEPLVAFILSINENDEDAEKLQNLRSLIDQEIAQHSAIHIKMSSGIFVASGV